MTVEAIAENMEDARLSEWTADGNVFGLGGHVHGCRASLLDVSLTAAVVCQCLDSDWRWTGDGLPPMDQGRNPPRRYAVMP